MHRTRSETEFSSFARQLTTITLISLICANLHTFSLFFSTPSPLRASLTYDDLLSVPPYDPTGLIPFRSEESFTPDELAAAISSLRLPTWSRGHLTCADSRSEVTCGQVVHAWRAIHAWEERISYIKNTSQIPVIHVWTKKGGVGNRVMQQLVSLVIAMKTGRRPFPFDNPTEYEWPATVVGANGCPLGHLHVDLPGDGGFFGINFTAPNYANNHLHLRMVFPSSMVYLHHQLAQFCKEAFGMHAQYFLVNYLMGIPKRYIDKCRFLTDPVPTTVRLFGLHLRVHFADAFFSRGWKETMSVVVPFCEMQRARKATTFVLATDNQKLFEEFGKVVKVLAAPVHRMTDGSVDSGITDITMLMLCEEWLLTWRSTYSALISQRMGRRPWMVEKYSKQVFMVSHSQVIFSQTPLYGQMPDWKVFEMSAVAAIATRGQVESIRFFYRWLAL
jgi:hypothetical protein